MQKNQALILAAAVFAIIVILQLLRSILKWEVSINGFYIPVWFSYIAVVVMGYLSWVMYNSRK